MFALEKFFDKWRKSPKSLNIYESKKSQINSTKILIIIQKILEKIEKRDFYPLFEWKLLIKLKSNVKKTIISLNFSQNIVLK